MKTAARRVTSLGFRARRSAPIEQAPLRGSLVVHIGSPKTATTSFQEMVAHNEEHFPLLYPITGRVWGVAHHNIAWELNDDARFRRRAGTLAGLVRELRAARPSAALISSEGFLRLWKRPDRLAQLRDAIVAAGYRPHIVVTLRDPCSYLESAYAQMRKRWGLAVEFDRFVANAVADRGMLFRGNDRPLDYAQLVGGFAAVFGTDAVTTVRYDPTDAITPLLSAIGSTLGVPLTPIEGWQRSNDREDAAASGYVQARATLSGEQRKAVQKAFQGQFEALTSGCALSGALGEARPSVRPTVPDDGVLNDTCPVCAGTSVPTALAVNTDRTYTVLCCRRCGLAFTVPRPPAAQLAARYHDAYFRGGHGCHYHPGHSGLPGPAAVHASRAWDSLGVWAPATRHAPRTLLDIGAATGEFAARAAADGWTVTAYEPGDSARAQAAAKGMTTISDLDEAAGPFGLITMFQVLEHVLDPVAMLRRCRELIDRDGLLAIELPHWRSWRRIIRRQRWDQLLPPEHINFFTRSSLRFALARTGWALSYVSTSYPTARPDLRAAIGRRDARTTVKRLGALTLGLSGCGDDLRALARPV